MCWPRPSWSGCIAAGRSSVDNYLTHFFDAVTVHLHTLFMSFSYAHNQHRLIKKVNPYLVLTILDVRFGWDLWGEGGA